ncbi:MAG: OB-fold domain-containing protein [Pseudomonadales bacterium]|nr:OB-fold domain-containing protein [Pseudomonadales bacterium]
MSGPLPEPRPMPKSTDDLNGQFWANCATGQLCFQRCLECDIWRHMPRYMCAHCGSHKWEWKQSSGKGKIFSWIITHQAMHPKFRGETPYAALVVEMEEGCRFVSRPLGITNEELEIDMPVEVVFEQINEDFALPLFRKAL